MSKPGHLRIQQEFNNMMATLLQQAAQTLHIMPFSSSIQSASVNKIWQNDPHDVIQCLR